VRGERPGSQFRKGGEWLAEMLLRLASMPGSLSSLESEYMPEDFKDVIQFPVAFRAARMLAILAEQRGEVWQWA
jgi:hypothetical protein